MTILGKESTGLDRYELITRYYYYYCYLVVLLVVLGSKVRCQHTKESRAIL